MKVISKPIKHNIYDNDGNVIETVKRDTSLSVITFDYNKDNKIRLQSLKIIKK